MDNFPKIKLARQRIHQWHGGVVYGNGLTVEDQVLGTADAVAFFYKEDDIANVLLGACIHKALDPKSLNVGAQDNDADSLVRDFGLRAAVIAFELAGDPKRKEDQSEKERLDEMKKWVKTLSKGAKVVFMAEKLQNFVTSLDNPDPKRDAAWHVAYVQDRMALVDLCQDAAPGLYRECQKMADAVLEQKKPRLMAHEPSWINLSLSRRAAQRTL